MAGIFKTSWGGLLWKKGMAAVTIPQRIPRKRPPGPAVQWKIRPRGIYTLTLTRHIIIYNRDAERRKAGRWIQPRGGEEAVSPLAAGRNRPSP